MGPKKAKILLSSWSARYGLVDCIVEYVEENDDPDKSSLVRLPSGRVVGVWNGLLGPVSDPTADDAVNHPKHYRSHPSGVECITITRHMGFNTGNAMKYLWRSDHKGNDIQDLEKAEFYIRDEIAKRKAAKQETQP